MKKLVLPSLLALATLSACAGDHDPSPDAGAPPDAAGGEEDAGDPPVPVDAALDAADPVPSICTACGACSEHFTNLSTAHVANGVDYSDVPPAGGSHDPCWKTVGVYEDEVEDERWVHNLEHGDVIFLHNCADDCADELDQMRALATGRAKTIMTPYAALPARFAVVAWGERLVSDCYDGEAFEAFYAAHVDDAPESVSSPPNLAVCAP